MPTMPASVDDGALFEVFNAYPNTSLGNEVPQEVQGPYPTMEEGYFTWMLPETHSAWAMFRKNGEWAVAEDWRGIPLVDMVKTMETHGYVERGEPDSPQVQMRKTREVRIHYRMAYPATRSKRNLRDLVPMYMLHGVPGSDEWKIPMMARFGRKEVVFAFSFLGMGRSTMPWDYRIDPSVVADPSHPDGAFDWRHDVPYIKAFMDSMQARHGFRLKPTFQTDDWGSGPGLRFIEAHPDYLKIKAFFNPIWNRSYFVTEIGAFARASWMVSPEKPLPRKPDGSFPLSVTKEQREAYYGNLVAFGPASATMPLTILQVEKNMVPDDSRFTMSRYAESLKLVAYNDVDYNAKRYARYMFQDQLGLAILCRRAGILAPIIMMAKDGVANPLGVDFSKIKHSPRNPDPMEVLFAMPNKDQMMSPIAMFLAPYLLNQLRVRVMEIKDEDHFVETSDPDYVFRALYAYQREVYGIDKMPIFVGDRHFVGHGTAPHLMRELSRLFGAPVTHDPREMDRLYPPEMANPGRYPKSSMPTSATDNNNGRFLGPALLGGAVGLGVGALVGSAVARRQEPQVVVVERERECESESTGKLF